jgi:hypothetical protein
MLWHVVSSDGGGGVVMMNESQRSYVGQPSSQQRKKPQHTNTGLSHIENSQTDSVCVCAVI